MQNVSLTDYQRGYRDALQEVKNYLAKRMHEINLDVETAEAASEKSDNPTIALRLHGLTYAFMEIRDLAELVENLTATTPEDPEVSHASI